MKKIASIIGNCTQCPWFGVYQKQELCCGTPKWASICQNQERVLLLTHAQFTPESVNIPDWCPLETYSGDSAPATETPATVILDCMPHLEWMTENLTGHGGTEIDGRLYYTWWQAMDAAKELGDGWRLPTAEEFEQLADAGSTWDDKGPDGEPGRWFGGNHDTDHEGSIFLPAAGYLNNSSGAVTAVAAYGYYWSSSPYSSEVYAGTLYFTSGGVYPVLNNYRAYGFSVRCVRDISER